MDIGLFAPLPAAFAAFFLGFIWYTLIFAKPWQKEIGMKADTKGGDTPNLALFLGGSLALEIIMAYIMAVLVGDNSKLMDGFEVGLMVGVLVALAFGVSYMFEGKSLKLWLINASYNIVVFVSMGLIIAAL